MTGQLEAGYLEVLQPAVSRNDGDNATKANAPQALAQGVFRVLDMHCLSSPHPVRWVGISILQLKKLRLPVVKYLAWIT